jgi:hypothetical protein
LVPPERSSFRSIGSTLSSAGRGIAATLRAQDVHAALACATAARYQDKPQESQGSGAVHQSEERVKGADMSVRHPFVSHCASTALRVPEMSKNIPSRSFLGLITSAALLVAGIVLPFGPAHARVWFGFGFPLYYPPQVYYPPAAYYPPPMIYAPPPPVTYTPPSTYAPPSRSQSCYAGAYICPMERPTASGNACYCPGNNGERVWGRAG